MRFWRAHTAHSQRATEFSKCNNTAQRYTAWQRIHVRNINNSTSHLTRRTRMQTRVALLLLLLPAENDVVADDIDDRIVSHSQCVSQSPLSRFVARIEYLSRLLFTIFPVALGISIHQKRRDSYISVWNLALSTVCLCDSVRFRFLFSLISHWSFSINGMDNKCHWIHSNYVIETK